MLKLSQRTIPHHLSILLAAVAATSWWLGSIPRSALAQSESDQRSVAALHAGLASSPTGGPAPGTAFSDGRIDDWVRVAFSEYSGPRLRIALAEIEERTEKVFEQDSWAGLDHVGDLTRKLSTLLDRTTRFDIASGSPPSNADVEYLVAGSVYRWSDAGTSTEHGAEPRGQVTAGLSMSLRVVDAATRQVLFSTTEQGHVRLEIAEADESATGAGGLDAALRSATEACVARSASHLVDWFQDRSWTGRVSAVHGELVSINAGRHQGLEIGMTLSTLARPRDLFDPESGEFLGSVSEHRALLRIVDVEAETALAAPIGRVDGLEPGDRVAWPAPSA